jgi:hypothetical protein
VPVVLPERLLHTAKVFTNFLHCNGIPLPIPDTSLHTCCSNTVVDESKQQIVLPYTRRVLGERSANGVGLHTHPAPCIPN